MKLCPLIITSCWLLVGCTSPKSCCPPTGDAPQQVADVAGDYAGTWSNSEGATGTLHISLKKSSDSPWQGKVSFTYDGNEAVTSMKSVEVNGTQILMAYEYKIQDSEGAVEMTGKLAGGNSLQGSYKITGGEGNPGNWEAKRAR